jgi:Fe-S cluster assembly protein SufD
METTTPTTGVLDATNQAQETLIFHSADWFATLRQQGWQRFQALPMPTREQEKWRFSDTRTLSFDGFAPAAYPSESTIAALLQRSQIISQPAGLIVHIDGHVVLEPQLSPELVSQGVIFESLEKALKHHPALLKHHLLQHPVNLGGDKFHALHQAWLRAGYFLHIPKGIVVTAPFVSVHWTSADNSAIFPHALVIAADRAQGQVLDFHFGAQLDSRALAISCCDVHTGQEAKLERLSVQAWGDQTQSFQVDNTCGGRGAEITAINAALGARRARLENTVRLDGPGADVHLYGISVATEGQEYDQRTLQIHAAPEAKSDLLFKNALLGKSRTIFSGLIKVEPDAQRTDAYQTNRNLILSPEAEADSLPGLEIEANDVKCSHGATTGQVSPEELFYLQARGIPLKLAQELLTQGFLEEILTKISHDEASEALRTLLREKFQRS